ncbi:MAG TPA: hypothetical protein VL995_20905 [Cellvibrio sp.]|nr:hypothetical protein [Cellvibrio sp.]
MSQCLEFQSVKSRPALWVRAITLALPISLSVFASSARAEIVNNFSTQDLEYGVVLFDYFQQDYFSALIEQEYAQAIGNPIAQSAEGQVMKGGMMLSYGMGDDAKKIFDDLLEQSAPVTVKNRAWFYLAKLFYSKSDLVNARDALARVSGELPKDLYTDYHYLVTLLSQSGIRLTEEDQKLKHVTKENPYYPYLLFNLAILQLKNSQLDDAVKNLEKVTTYAGISEELSLLADRARHGLAELAIKHGKLVNAWNYLKEIRTTGFYSNRALLSYAWAAINLKQFKQAIPALEILSNRSIAIPEVQEGKVLLAHLYEQEGSPRKALKRNILAEKEFHQGIEMINVARQVIKEQDVPREFIENLHAMMDDTDWYNTKPTVNYHKLTPFLIDLMASHPFNETLRELADLYSIEANLKYWLIQAEEHRLILENAGKKQFLKDPVTDIVNRSQIVKDKLVDQTTEYRLHSLALPEKDQERMSALVQTTEDELELLDARISKLANYKQPYQQPGDYRALVLQKHSEIEYQLAQTRRYINGVEVIMRQLVAQELNKHEERMRYYAAQSKLAKARLYDMTLLSLEKARSSGKKEADASAGESRK